MRERNEFILADMIQAKAEKQPDLDVLTFEHLSLDDGASEDEIRTYADLQTNGNRLAADLIARGMAPGDRFGLMMRNHPEYVESMIAASISGCVLVPIDPRTRGEKLVYMLRNAGCQGVICADYCLAEVARARLDVSDIKWILGLETGETAQAVALDSEDAVESLRDALNRPADTLEPRLKDASDPLQIIYTSGTTGDPKGLVFQNFRFGFSSMLGVIFGYQENERPYTGLSLTHGNAQAVTLAPALGAGLRAIFSRRFTKSKLFDVCRAYGGTTFSQLGGMATAIYSEPERADDADNPVRLLVSAGMPPAIWSAFEKRFGLDIYEWYGAVEGGFAFKPVGEGPVGSFGKPGADLEMKILDENDVECPPGVTGEISSRPVDRKQKAEVEYYDNPEASEKKTHGGWLRSGDMGHRDEDGWFYFDFRAGGGLRHNGDFVSPSFVEKVIAEHPQVSDVFVYGVEAASGAPGEKDVVAAVVAQQPEEFTPSSVFAACRVGLESNFVPTYLQVVDEIPKTASEKPQIRFLLDAFTANPDTVFTEQSAASSARE
ncbi:MAG: AMP-binding protein [Pseudomonadales bacterium]|jgi:crotonobetaine/carnitine-CoA ligase|nr:ATP-dependent acyl-CoA ligase [Gammaproteobacteria bacterium]MDP6026098.1 AMP-binding protein [Pseudomonadales bacterium]MDP7315540.1 AMP-binding protein [Pseudomonadales bacterium]MDP7452695.1 AMP-binding protein [Arenicellales bacterium]|tara:strand:- start:2366 stop:4009 length:1644 start_codon:yes stop_codon:yes gene_type:complete